MVMMNFHKYDQYIINHEILKNCQRKGLNNIKHWESILKEKDATPDQRRVSRDGLEMARETQSRIEELIQRIGNSNA